jgi:3-methylcrotonyl-CoA carboxylase alpha subunit
MFKKILIANRGEIAIRIMTTCHEMGIRSVAVYSEADQHARHVFSADEAYLLGPAPASQSYLRGDAIIEIAKRSHAEAIHPGYGFLAENADFAAACEQAGITFIGPSARVIALMGSKIAAKQLAQSVAAPTVPGYSGESQEIEVLQQEAEHIGFPLLIKASAGGGGKGMRVVQRAQDFLEQLAGARREAQAAFNDSTVFLERYLQQPRHIEIQILADHHGNIVHLGERECSIQRRHQKIIEESPSSVLSPALRQHMGEVAIRITQAAHYTNAGTLEFMLDTTNQFYFLEMNTRLQVEHPITELVTGLDLVRQQLRIAVGEPLGMAQKDIIFRGHAIEARLYAEDPQQQFLPSTGTITSFIKPEGPGIRVDSGVETGDSVTPYYDPMLAKLIVYAENRLAAIARLQYALERCAIFGLTTNISLLHAISSSPAFSRGDTPTNFLELQHLVSPVSEPYLPEAVLIAAAIYEIDYELYQQSPTLATSNCSTNSSSSNPWQTLGPWRIGQGWRTFNYQYQDQDYAVTIQPTTKRQGEWRIGLPQQPLQDVTAILSSQHQIILKRQGTQLPIYIHRQKHAIDLSLKGQYYQLQRQQPPDIASATQGGNVLQRQKNLTAPMSGTIVKIQVSDGDIVEAHQVLLILSAMKMEHAITAPYAGRVHHIHYAEGAVVSGGAIVADMEVES